MAGSEITVGTPVQLAHGGPIMTVTEIDDASATCAWHDDKQNAKYGAFPVAALRVVKPGGGVYLARARHGISEYGCDDS